MNDEELRERLKRAEDEIERLRGEAILTRSILFVALRLAISVNPARTAVSISEIENIFTRGGLSSEIQPDSLAREGAKRVVNEFRKFAACVFKHDPDYVRSSSALRTRNAIVLEISSETGIRRPSGRKRGFGVA